MGPRDWHPGVKPLRTKARDNHGYEYRVYLEMDKDRKWVLHVADTPGHWYMSTLLESTGLRDRISLDFGQKWDVINFDEIMAEAVHLV
jgi:hypothetical protein